MHIFTLIYPFLLIVHFQRWILQYVVTLKKKWILDSISLPCSCHTIVSCFIVCKFDNIQFSLSLFVLWLNCTVFCTSMEILFCWSSWKSTDINFTKARESETIEEKTTKVFTLPGSTNIDNFCKVNMIFEDRNRCMIFSSSYFQSLKKYVKSIRRKLAGKGG